MKSLNVFKIPALIALLALAACAKKDSDFAARYARNGTGAAAVNIEETGAAGEYAAGKGLHTADIVGLQRTRNGTAAQITGQIVLNNQQIQVTTQHTGSEVREGAVRVGNYQVQFHAMCLNSSCEPYFAAMEVYTSSGEFLIQEGVRIYFNDPSRSVYQLFKPGSARVFFNGKLADPSSMVGYLNSFNAGIGL
ncbi:hypothetical protein [Bdellovibrio sp. HCB2-146]|uniref:hypothetical protein n=1 Tax=Bdellovibrio sp. HCB2-146 TaxID=3394362 RepID=UPI0039BC531D